MNATEPKAAVRGFTLIELMVVITIIALLAVAILPQLTEGQVRANQAADQLNLKWHFQAITLYKDRHKTGPRGGGHQFVLDTWVRNIVEHTQQNMERYFSPQAIGDGDERYQELRDLEANEYWKSRDDITSDDTNWAGRGSGKQNKKGMWSGNEILLATDNEGGNVYKDGAVVVLFGDGHIKTLFRDPDFMKYGYSEDVDTDEHIEVGPNSLHPKLQKLEH